jgi:hypothetical protein
MAQTTTEEAFANGLAARTSRRAVLNAERYTDASVPAAEWDRIWARCWLFAGLVSDLPDPGDYFTYSVGRESIVVMRYHGVLAPNHRWRGLVTQAKRGKGGMRPSNKEAAYPTERHAAMTWAQRLKRVFKIDIEVCNRSQGRQTAYLPIGVRYGCAGSSRGKGRL